jgi:DNA-binding CsgD family transcriptional regulator/tetratricopeptide (TPR) repeat protein
MALLERESSLASLAEYAEEARRGEGRLVLVGGEAGVGKSALVEHFAGEVAGTRWSWGACDGLFTPRPLGPLFDIAEQLGGELLDLCRARAPRDELFAALLREASDPGTLHVVVIEDLHWADEATIDLLCFLGRRVRNAAMLLIGTYRDDDAETSDLLRLALGELARQRSTRRIVLAPLSADAVSVLAAGSGLETAALFQLTGGNPFYVCEVIQAGMDEVPASARDAVLARVVSLSSESRELLDAAALIGARVELRLLEAVMPGRPSAIDELTASGLLAGDGPWLRFRHEIARLAVEQAIAAHRRGAVHGRILAALHSLDCDDDARMAFHAEGTADGPAVLRYAPSAARRATELGSHREAAAQFERALRFAALADPATVAGLYDGLAYEVTLLDRLQDAADARQSALGLWRLAGDRLREGDTMRRFSRTMGRLCRGREAVAAAQEAVSILEPLGPSTELAWAYAGLATQRLMDAQRPAAIELALRAQAIAEPLGVHEVHSDALNTQGCAAACLGRPWTGLLHRALDIALREGLDEQAGRAFANLYATYCAQRRFADGEPYYLDGIAYCDEHDMTTWASSLRGERTSALEKTGRWDEAVTLGTDLLSRANPSPINRVCPLTELGLIRGRRSEPSAWDYLDQAITDADQSGEPQRIVPARLARAEVYWLEGKPGEAAREAELADDGSARCDAWDRGAVAVWIQRLASGRAPRDDLAEPRRLQIDGDWARAGELWTALGCPYEAAMALLDATDEQALREALTIFTGLGASAPARVTRRKMRRLGIHSIPVGPRTATRAHPLGLTKREREVLDLICAGHSNAEIAAHLFISAKTVDHHVSAVLAKLDAPTRNAAASRATRLGLVGTAESR